MRERPYKDGGRYWSHGYKTRHVEKWKKVLVTHSCPSHCDPMDCSPPGSSVHGILQARILEWVAIPFSRRSSWPRDPIQVSRIAGGFFTPWATTESGLTAKRAKNRLSLEPLKGVWPCQHLDFGWLAYRYCEGIDFWGFKLPSLW